VPHLGRNSDRDELSFHRDRLIDDYVAAGHGVLALSVGSRIKEIAVRKAVGAEWQGIVRMVLGEGFRLVGIGIVLGVVLSVIVGRVLGTLLFGVEPADPGMLAGAAAVFAIAAVTACALPAWRATRVDLMEALRRD
jgi:putative ABC transport system permease protein